jgi:hypothetical protein
MCRGTRYVPEVTTETMKTSPKARLFASGVTVILFVTWTFD